MGFSVVVRWPRPERGGGAGGARPEKRASQLAAIRPSGNNEISREAEAVFSVAMTHQQIALAISAICFGLVIGFFAGYPLGAYISYHRHRPND